MHMLPMHVICILAVNMSRTVNVLHSKCTPSTVSYVYVELYVVGRFTRGIVRVATLSGHFCGGPLQSEVHCISWTSV